MGLIRRTGALDVSVSMAGSIILPNTKLVVRSTQALYLELSRDLWCFVHCMDVLSSLSHSHNVKELSVKLCPLMMHRAL
jgi:hypothetical protein